MRPLSGTTQQSGPFGMQGNMRDADTILFATSGRKRSHRNNIELGKDRV
jgi:hypothetical protein